ncbi:cytochrome P450 [Streptomyces resistomycificus]|uniref:Cytochrome P450 n=1 Tax=Streptomyces resistomycificus TaxID=67356 RepID=A0A0L8L000_9ACTN|nr:cytochrome P450 [Streptomyces resistomycificus]KOG31426.1 hypothetical protein ADK37_31205 [Streptomyces resistomycificus]KUN94220.1 hypothetical protein AQJ84_26315 [Streptomyces resistomycificus]
MRPRAAAGAQAKVWASPDAERPFTCPSSSWSPYPHQHDPGPFPDPLTFDPDHWEPGRAAGTRGSFLAFGDGRRECIGENFAGAELQITLATGLRT